MAGTKSNPANSGALRPPDNGSRSAVVRAVVLMVNMEVTEVVLGVMEVERDVQLAAEGSPALQDSVTVPLKLFFPNLAQS
jgi:hypothetical protein